LDDIKDLGFRSWRSAVVYHLTSATWIELESKPALIDAAQAEVDEVISNYNMGLITKNERYNQIIDIWSRLNTKLTGDLITKLTNDNKDSTLCS
jgi:DNA-directed RNA polymerase subunit beta'